MRTHSIFDPNGEVKYVFVHIANRCQIELQKTIGSPAQMSELRAMSKDLSALDARLESMAKRIDSLDNVRVFPFSRIC